MGLLSFAKSVGSKIFGAAGAVATSLEQAAPPGQPEKEAKQPGLGQTQAVAEPKGEVEAAPEVASALSPDEESKTAAPTPLDEEPAEAAAGPAGTAQAGQTAEAKYYTVKPGDTLWKIAETEYGEGHGGKYHEIFEANLAVLSDPDEIQPGQVLRIPPLAD